MQSINYTKILCYNCVVSSISRLYVPSCDLSTSYHALMPSPVRYGHVHREVQTYYVETFEARQECHEEEEAVADGEGEGEGSDSILVPRASASILAFFSSAVSSLPAAPMSTKAKIIMTTTEMPTIIQNATWKLLLCPSPLALLAATAVSAMPRNRHMPTYSVQFIRAPASPWWRRGRRVVMKTLEVV